MTWIYNEFFWATVLLQSGDKFPITSSLNNLRGQFFTDNNLVAAGSVVVALPPLIVFFILQKQFVVRPDAGGHQGMTRAPKPRATGVLHLRAAGASVVVDASGPGVPAVLHWGRDSATRCLPRRPGCRPCRTARSTSRCLSPCWPAGWERRNTARRCAGPRTGRHAGAWTMSPEGPAT